MPPVMKSRVVLAACALWAGLAYANPDVIRQAQALHEQGNPAEAYALLQPLKASLAGEVGYDYWLGITALDAGKPGEAVFALERVLAKQPDHPQARAEIARAYFELGELEAAKLSFEQVKRSQPEAAVMQRIDGYLSAIAQADGGELAGERTRVRGYVEATLGRDTNVNNATERTRIALPAFGGAIATLNAAGRRQVDSFFALGGGLNVVHMMSPTTAVVGNISYQQRRNAEQDRFDTASFDAYGGFVSREGPHRVSGVVQVQRFIIDNRPFRNAYGLTAQYQYALTPTSQVSAYLQFANLRYESGQDLRHADRRVLGVAYGAESGWLDKMNWYVGAYGGRETERRTGLQHLGHRLFGLRAGTSWAWGNQVRPMLSVSYEKRGYGGDEPLFNMPRQDRQYDLGFAMDVALTKQWILTPRVGYTRNRSNVAIYDYQRALGSVTIRREF